jgi:hypothetical protein
LRRRLTLRGVTIPAGLVAAGTVSQSHAAVPVALVDSTIQIVLGLAACDTAAVLARGVLQTMVLSQIRNVTAAVLLAATGCLIAGYAWAIGPRQAKQPSGAKARTVISAMVRTESIQKATREPLLVRGLVVDETGRPVAGALVRADALTNRETRGITGADGSYTIPIRRPRVDGRAILASSADGAQLGYSQYDFNTTKAAADAPARIVLKLGRDVVVRVTDSTGAPVPGASVEAAGNEILDSATTGSDGSARLRVPVDATVHQVIALKSGTGFDYWSPEFFSAPPFFQGKDPELPSSIPLTLDGARTVRIEAFDRAGTPLVGVVFHPWRLFKAGRTTEVHFEGRISGAITGPDGFAALDWLPANNKALAFWPEAEGYADRRVVLQEGEGGPVTVTLTRKEAIRGRVTLPDGAPAEGILVYAISSQGVDYGQGTVRSAADGSYEMDVDADEAYAVYVDDDHWAAPSRLDVVVRDRKPVDGVDFKLVPGTIIRGTVTFGPGNWRAAEEVLGLVETGGEAPNVLRELGDLVARETRRYCGTATDSEGRYEILVGPGTYRLESQTRTDDKKIAVNGEREIVRDFKVPRPAFGALTGRIVTVVASDKWVAGAKVQFAAVNAPGIPFTLTSDALGRFETSRRSYPLIVCATSSDGKLGAIVEVRAGDTQVTISLSPTASATGVLLDQNGQVAANQELDWGRRVFVDEDKNASYFGFVSNVVTNAHGRFTLPALVVGQEYEICLRSDNVQHAAGAVRPEAASLIDLGTLRAGSQPPKLPAIADEEWRP